MLSLIDSDTLAYAAAVVTEGQSEQIAIWTVNDSIEKLLVELNTNEFQLYLTGEGNFRYSVYPEYKAHRSKMQRPTHLKLLKEHMVKEWGAVLSEGCEADDLIGVDTMQAHADEREVLVVHIDKDIDQIPGLHYNPRKKLRYHVSPLDGLRFFYYQLLVGDTADHIKGAPGIGPKKAEKALKGLTEEWDLFQACSALYPDEESLLINGQCLWIWKKMNDIWSIPKDIIEE